MNPFPNPINGILRFIYRSVPCWSVFSSSDELSRFRGVSLAHVGFSTRQEDVSVAFLPWSCCDPCVQPVVLLWDDNVCI